MSITPSDLVAHMTATVGSNDAAVQALSSTFHFSPLAAVGIFMPGRPLALHNATGLVWAVIAPEQDGETYAAYRVAADGLGLDSWEDRDGEFVEADDIDALADAIHATR